MPDPSPLPVSTDVGAAAAPDTSAPVPSQPDPGQPAVDPASVGAVTGAPPAPDFGTSQFDNDFREAAQKGDTSRLTGLVHGAMMAILAGRGLAGAAIGAGVGAAEPQDVNALYQQQKDVRAAQVSEAQSNAQFANFRAAIAQTEALQDGYNLRALPDPLQAQQDGIAKDQIAALSSAGNKPIVAQDVPGAASAILNELQQRYGAVPFVSVVHRQGLIYVFPVGGSGSDYNSYQKLAREAGQDAVSESVWSGLKSDKQAELLHGVQTFFTSVPDADHIDQSIAQTQLGKQTFLQNAQVGPSEKAAVSKRYDDRLAFLQKVQAFYDSRNAQYLRQKEAAKQRAAEAEQGKPSLFGDTTDLDPKQYGMTLRQYKPNRDALAKTEQSYAMFLDAASAARKAINGGPDMSGAQSVVTLFNAIGLSATPLKGMGFRINNNTVSEHANARSLGQGLYQKLLSVKAGDVITPQQVLDYTKIAGQARLEAYRSAISDARNVGLKADNFMPHGFGKPLDANTQQIFLSAANGDAKVAARAAKLYGWVF